MGRAPRLDVRFRVAAGPRCGYGHLVRCRVLAEAMGVVPRVSVRGPACARTVARRLGCVVDRRRAFGRTPPDLLVIDDPRPDEVARSVRAARTRSVPVASLHDLGLGLGSQPADLTVDGTVAGAGRSLGADLCGPSYAVLSPALLERRAALAPREAGHVLIALGGGGHVRRAGVGLAARLRQAVPDLRVLIAAGFTAPGRLPGLPAGCRWLSAPGGLAAALAEARVVVSAGGLTLYEACALGAPVVALAVARAQRPTIRSFARAGAAVDAGGAWQRGAADRVAAAVIGLVADPAGAADLGRRGRALVDGRGAARVARHLHALVARRTGEEVRRAA